MSDVSEQIFSDGIGAIAMVGGVVRIDLVVMSPTEKDAGGQPKPVFQQQIVMGAEAFLRSTEKMQAAAQTLVKMAAQPRAVPSEEPRSSANPEPAPRGPFP